MSSAVLIQLFLSILGQRAAAGFPYLVKLLERWGGKIQKDADALPNKENIKFGDAPADLVKLLTDLLTQLRDTASLKMKIVYSILLSLVPSVANKLWDKLFEMKQVATPAPVQTHHIDIDAFEEIDDFLDI